MYEIFITRLSGHSAQRSSTVLEHKKLRMLVVCDLIRIVQAAPHVFFLLVHPISSGFWFGLLLSTQNCLTNILTVFGVGTRGH